MLQLEEEVLIDIRNITLVYPDLLSFQEKLKSGIVCGIWVFT